MATKTTPGTHCTKDLTLSSTLIHLGWKSVEMQVEPSDNGRPPQVWITLQAPEGTDMQATLHNFVARKLSIEPNGYERVRRELLREIKQLSV